jgi:hypothetical protein
VFLKASFQWVGNTEASEHIYSKCIICLASAKGHIKEGDLQGPSHAWRES